MTKSTQQLADEMARKCADTLIESDRPFACDIDNECYIECVECRRIEVAEMAETIKQLVSLNELFEVAIAAREEAGNGDHSVHCGCGLCKALTNLQKKVEL